MNTRFDPKNVEARKVRPPEFGRKETPEILTATEARQGAPGRPVLIVLVSGLILAFLAWGGAEWWGQTTAPPAEQTATPPSGDNTPAAPADDAVKPQAPTENVRPSGNP